MPLFPILILAGIAGAYFWVQSGGSLSFGGDNSQSGDSSGGGDGSSSVSSGSNPWNLPDIDSAHQLGAFKKDFDSSFEKASGATSVPFALIKAHAIRESSLVPGAYHYDNASAGASYGLMQVEWKPGSNRLAQFGSQYSADSIRDGSILYDPDTSAFLGASIIAQNLRHFKGNLRDSINAYNTGVAESIRQAPANYVDDVLNYYQAIIGASINA